MVDRCFGGLGSLRGCSRLKEFKLNLPLESKVYRPATSSISSILLKNKLIAEEISGGHAYLKHVITRNEFNGYSRFEFEQHLRSILNNPSQVKFLTNGRTAYWDDISETIIIRSPLTKDGGTAFRPRDGKNYFDYILK